MLVDWMEMASCARMDPEDFFDNYLKTEQAATRVAHACNACPVHVECFNYGVQMRCTGIWGGRWFQMGKIMRQKELIMSDYFWEDEE